MLYIFVFKIWLNAFASIEIWIKLWRGLMSNKSVKTSPSFQDCEVQHEVYPRFRKKKLSWCNSNDGDCCVDNKRYFGSENSRFNFTGSLNFHFISTLATAFTTNSKTWPRAKNKIRVTVNQKVKSGHNKTYGYNCVTRDSKCLLSSDWRLISTDFEIPYSYHKHSLTE